jgi:N-acetyl-anhydromuramyl-L-alanine amidase AmpD
MLMRNVRTLAVVLGTAAVLAACDAPTPPVQPEQPAAAASRLDPMFARAASEFGVPADLLKAVAFTETGWQFARGDESDMEGLAPAYGIFALRGERLERGARLAGVSAEAARTDVEASIRAGAALLRAEGEALRVAGDDLGAWAPAVARFSGISNDQATAGYVHQGVYGALRQGVSEQPQQATLAAHPGVKPTTPAPASRTALTTEYGPAIWTPSPNYTSGRSGYSTALVVIHTCAGNYSGCWSWLTNTSSGVSAHYVVGQTDIGGGVAEVRQLVDEDNTAWHVGKSWQGYPTNPRSIGIEHGGFSYGSNGYGPWPAVQYNTSATLTCDIVKSRGIIRDRDHIIGHYQPDPVNRAHDPGQGFPWADYMSRINSCVGGTTGGTALTVDSHTNGTDARFSASANWISSAGTAGYYGSGYYYASTAAVSDPANFEFYLPAAATKSVSAYWTSGTNRSASAPYIMYNASGTEVGRVSANQQTGGGAWQSLGSYSFSAGWNRVSLSRWTTTGYVVIADAVRIQ